VRGGAAGWLLEALGGRFVLLTVGEAAREVPSAGLARVHVALDGESAREGDLADGGDVAARYGHDRVYLVRPDQHVAARFTAEEARGGEAVPAALARALPGRVKEAAE
jgi:3-(3-hydroxy-phenyl)propionate hydroxylase